VTDGAKRDRLIWAGDMEVENLVGNYSLGPAPGILRQSLQAFSCQQYNDGQLSPASQIAVQCPLNPPGSATDSSSFPPAAQRRPGWRRSAAPAIPGRLGQRAPRLLHVHR
jgi:hypothetical protein